MLHMQKMGLGLNLTGDQVLEKQVEKNNMRQIYQLIK